MDAQVRKPPVVGLGPEVAVLQTDVARSRMEPRVESRRGMVEMKLGMKGGVPQRKMRRKMVAMEADDRQCRGCGRDYDGLPAEVMQCVGGLDEAVGAAFAVPVCRSQEQEEWAPW